MTTPPDTRPQPRRTKSAGPAPAEVVAAGPVPEPGPGPTESPGMLEAVWFAGWIGFWTLVETHHVGWALALQAAICFGCAVAYMATTQPRWAVGTIVSLLPLLSGLAPYGHTTNAKRVAEVAALQLVAVALLLRDRNVLLTVRQSLARTRTTSARVVWGERFVALGASIAVGYAISQLHPTLVLGLHAPDIARNTAALAAAFVAEELTFHLLLLAVTARFRWYWTALAQYAVVGACFAASGSALTGFVAGLVGAALAAYRIRDGSLWPIAISHAAILAIICAS